MDKVKPRRDGNGNIIKVHVKQDWAFSIDERMGQNDLLPITANIIPGLLRDKLMKRSLLSIMKIMWSTPSRETCKAKGITRQLGTYCMTHPWGYSMTNFIRHMVQHEPPTGKITKFR